LDLSNWTINMITPLVSSDSSWIIILTGWHLHDWQADTYMTDRLTLTWLTGWHLHDWQADTYMTDRLTLTWLTGWHLHDWQADTYMTDRLTLTWLTGWHLHDWQADTYMTCWLLHVMCNFYDCKSCLIIIYKLRLKLFLIQLIKKIQITYYIIYHDLI
jgi:hypothetical protein